MYSHSRSVVFFLHQTYQWLLAFYPFLHPHTNSPEEKLNLIVNKTNGLFKNADIKHAVNQVDICLFIFHSFSVFIQINFWIK